MENRKQKDSEQPTPSTTSKPSSLEPEKENTANSTSSEDRSISLEELEKLGRVTMVDGEETYAEYHVYPGYCPASRGDC